MKVVWDESLSVGVTEIDEQHKIIFNNFNVFSAACRDGHGAEKLDDLFWFLGSYVATHFANEERLMQQVGFPDYPEHHELHTAFVSKVDEIRGRFSQEGPSEEVVATINGAIKEWLVEHISVMDRTLGRFMTNQ